MKWFYFSIKWRHSIRLSNKQIYYFYFKQYESCYNVITHRQFKQAHKFDNELCPSNLYTLVHIYVPNFGRQNPSASFNDLTLSSFFDFRSCEALWYCPVRYRVCAYQYTSSGFPAHCNIEQYFIIFFLIILINQDLIIHKILFH